ncbi:MAG TPA: hypothetical protein VFE41_06330 [Acetobacteraceae bacterium]|jgi:antitoxin ParD1/3/4|nr:hypothetical protein [Acetobacteraceae bacterium]
MADISDELPSSAASIAQAKMLREQARTGGLRFEAYLPSSLAEWLLDLIERGLSTDPSEAVFVMIGEQQELEPHADLRKELLRRACQAAIDDPRPGIPHEQVMEQMKKRMAAPRPQPAAWRRPTSWASSRHHPPGRVYHQLAHLTLCRRPRGRHRDQARQPQFSGDRDHSVSKERRHAGEGGADGEPC